MLSAKSKENFVNEPACICKVYIWSVTFFGIVLELYSKIFTNLLIDIHFWYKIPLVDCKESIIFYWL